VPSRRWFKLTALLPFGCLGTTMRHDNWLSPLLMTALALPLYLGPLQGMMRLGLMFEHGNSVGARSTSASKRCRISSTVDFIALSWHLPAFGGSSTP
jgi:hypothetical protein